MSADNQIEDLKQRFQKDLDRLVSTAGQAIYNAERETAFKIAGRILPFVAHESLKVYEGMFIIVAYTRVESSEYVPFTTTYEWMPTAVHHRNEGVSLLSAALDEYAYIIDKLARGAKTR